MTEAEFGRAWQALAKREGHRQGVPRVQIPPPPRIPAPKVMPMTAETKRVVEHVERAHGLKPGSLEGRDAKRDIAHPRQDAWRLVSILTGYGTMRIGHMFGRNHTTVRDGMIASRVRCELDTGARDRFDAIRSELEDGR